VFQKQTLECVWPSRFYGSWTPLEQLSASFVPWWRKDPRFARRARGMSRTGLSIIITEQTRIGWMNIAIAGVFSTLKARYRCDFVLNLKCREAGLMRRETTYMKAVTLAGKATSLGLTPHLPQHQPRIVIVISETVQSCRPSRFRECSPWEFWDGVASMSAAMVDVRLNAA